MNIKTFIRSLYILRRRHCAYRCKPIMANDSTLILAPHPDDEVFGCGGLIARLVAEGRAPYVAVLTGGGGSHRNCCDVAEEKIVAARRRLTRKALAELGLPPENIYELDYTDGDISGEHQKQEDCLRRIIDELKPATILVPHRGEGWPDHLAVRELGVKLVPKDAEVYEYCVWMWYYRQRTLDWTNAVCLRMTPREHARKLAAIQAYTEACAPCGNPWVGVLPQLFVKANSADVELFFKLK